MDPRFTLEVSKFNAAMREMSASLRHHATEREIIDFEVGKIIEKALAETDTATVASIKFSMEATEWKTYDGKKYKLTNRYPTRVWGMIKGRLAASLRRRVAARGSAKKSWLALARRIGVEIKAPGYVATANIPSHPAEENVAVERTNGEFRYGIRITNSSPILRWAKGRQAFFGAVIGRRKFFEQNLARGVFRKLETVAKKYKGLIIAGP